MPYAFYPISYVFLYGSCFGDSVRYLHIVHRNRRRRCGNYSTAPNHTEPHRRSVRRCGIYTYPIDWWLWKNRTYPNGNLNSNFCNGLTTGYGCFSRVGFWLIAYYIQWIRDQWSGQAKEVLIIYSMQFARDQIYYYEHNLTEIKEPMLMQYDLNSKAENLPFRSSIKSISCWRCVRQK